jgi:hypothetical protein
VPEVPRPSVLDVLDLVDLVLDLGLILARERTTAAPRRDGLRPVYNSGERPSGGGCDATGLLS